MYTILIYAPPLSPLTPLVPHPNTCSSRLHALSYCFFNSQTESNKQLPSNHTLEANFSSSPLCQELFGLEVEPHKPLPHSSWDYWSVWTCTGNHGHHEFMSTTAMSCPGDSMSQRSSPFPSSYTEICLRDVYDSPKPLFVPLKGHNWTTFPFPVSLGVCKDTYQVGRVTQDLSVRALHTFPIDGPPSRPVAPSSCWKMQASAIPFTCADSPSHTVWTTERSSARRSRHQAWHLEHSEKGKPRGVTTATTSDATMVIILVSKMWSVDCLGQNQCPWRLTITTSFPKCI